MLPAVDVLIVEDNDLHALLLRVAIERTGIDHRIVRATCADGAVEEIRCGFRPKVIFVDVRLAGGVDGVQLAQLLRMMPQCRQATIAFYTADPESLLAQVPDATPIFKPPDVNAVASVLDTARLERLGRTIERHLR